MVFSFLCGFCNDILDNQQALKDHYESQHPMDEVDWAKETVCLACGMAFQKTLGLKRHFRQMGPHHSGQCSQCDVTVNTWDKMVRHVREAHGGKFACSNCQNIFDDDEREKFIFSTLFVVRGVRVGVGGAISHTFIFNFY